MARWVRVVLLVVCVGHVANAAVELPSLLRGRPRSHSRREPRYRSRASYRRRLHRPSVPESVQPITEIESPMEQFQKLLLEQITNDVQSDQPHSALKLLRDDINIMNDAAFGANPEAFVEWTELFSEIIQNHGCQKPVRQLVRVSQVHPTTSAAYSPSSVLLRRCSDQTSFCTGGGDHRTCVSNGTATIQLAIHVKEMVGNKSAGIKYLSFVEDTGCRCSDMTAAMRQASAECPRNLPINDASDTRRSRMGKKRNRRRNGRNQEKSAKQTCNCTSEFASRQLPSGKCKCDCFMSNRKCKRQQRGKHLSEKDNKCIVKGSCKPPVCKFGKYAKTYGRCPRRKGEFRLRQHRFTV